MTMAKPRLQGWAYMKNNDPERFAELTRKGGSSVPKEKRSFSQDRDLARLAGHLGGSASRIVQAR